MSDTITLGISSDLTQFIDEIVLDSPAGKKAIRSALKEMRTWMSREVKRAVSKSIDVRQKDLNEVLKTRVHTRIMFDDYVADIWVGLNPFPLIDMGAEQAPPGVIWADKHLRLGTFIATLHGKENVYKRKFSGPGSSQRGRGDGRFPIMKQSVPVYDVVADAFSKIEKRAAAEFQKRFLRRLDFYQNKPARKRR